MKQKSSAEDQKQKTKNNTVANPPANITLNIITNW